jgi:hypothetical protein
MRWSRARISGDRTMIAFGGNGPLHATRVARRAGVSRIVIPRDPGVGSAVGFLHAPVSFEIVRSRYATLARRSTAGPQRALRGTICARGDRRSCARAMPDAPLVDHAAARLHALSRAGPRDRNPAADRRDLTAADIDGADSGGFRGGVRPPVQPPRPRHARSRFSTGPVSVSTASAPTPLAIRRHRPTRGRQPVGHETRVIACDLRRGRAGFRPTSTTATFLAPGDTLEGPALIVEPQTTTLAQRRLHRHDRRGRQHCDDPRRWRGMSPSSETRLQVMWSRLAVGGRGTGTGAHARGLQPHRARMRRHLGRHLRPTGPHAGAGRHRHAGAHQHHGGGGQNALARFDAATMAPGDIYLTNDPWIASGHLNDFLLMMPVFHGRDVIGYHRLHLAPDRPRRAAVWGPKAPTSTTRAS